MAKERKLENAMKKPSELLLRLVDLGCLQGLRVDYRQTGTDTAETFVTIAGSNGKAAGKWSSYRDFLEVGVDYASVCRVKSTYVQQVKDWRAFEAQNAAELAEYARLKQKFGGANA